MKTMPLEDSFSSLAAGKHAATDLPGGGRFRMDRPLPFIVLYRPRVAGLPRELEKIATAHASSLVFSDERDPRAPEILRRCSELMRERFGAFLALEIWPDSAALNDGHSTASQLRPFFEVRLAKSTAAALPETVTILEKALERIEVHRRSARIEIQAGKKNRPDGAKPILDPSARKRQIFAIGLQVRPIFLNVETRTLFPLLFQGFLTQLSLAIKETFSEFIRSNTNRNVSHHYALGPSKLTRAVQAVDRELSACSESFSFLLQVTPVNTEAAWRRFSGKQFSQEPVFAYRPLPVDPELLKRRLYSIELERVEDPALSTLFRRKRNEIDRQLTMLFDVDTPRFLHGSLQLYGGVEPDLLELAERILETVPQDESPDDEEKRPVTDKAFARRAQREIEEYRKREPNFEADVEIRADFPPGILVSGKTLFIGKGTRLARNRVEGLIQHEVGTHLLTQYNGRTQPLRQLHAGLAGYEELQEGLATFAEFLVGELTPSRLRMLAARVVTVRAMLDGATFTETFHLLTDERGFSARSAFITTMRVFRGGGFSKDAIYLRGLCDLLLLLQGEQRLDSLYLGKIAFDQIPLVDELLHRRVLKRSALLPTLFERETARTRYERARSGLHLLDLYRNGESA